MLSDLLSGDDLVFEPKIYFLVEPMESSTYLDHQYFIIFQIYQQKSNIVVNNSM